VTQLLAVEHKTVRRLIDRGELPALRVGRVLRIDRADLEALRYRPDGAERAACPRLGPYEGCSPGWRARLGCCPRMTR
jgi:excisionase family DNA binding protein